MRCPQVSIATMLKEPYFYQNGPFLGRIEIPPQKFKISGGNVSTVEKRSEKRDISFTDRSLNVEDLASLIKPE